MSRTILLDANVIDQINRGNVPAANALVGMIKSGDRVFIAKQAYNELVVNTFPRSATANRLLLERLGIGVAPAGAMATRVDVYAQNQTRTGSVVSLPDSLVAAQAKAMDAEVWSFDGPFRTNAAVSTRLGVKVAPESSRIPMVGGVGSTGASPSDYRTGYRLVGLPPVEIDGSGDVVRRGPAGSPPGAPGAKSARVGVAENRGPSIGGPSPQGTATIGGIQLAFQGINFVLNAVNDAVQTKRVREALARVEPSINAERMANPTLGVVLIFFYRQVVAPPESIIRPGPVFMHVEYALGQTEDEALENWAAKPAVRSGVGSGERLNSQRVWIPALHAVAIGQLRTPFAIAFHGTFVAKAAARLQDVSWNGVFGFDDERETWLRLRDGEPLGEFAILTPPATLDWSNGSRTLTTDIPLVSRTSADGTLLTVVDLDPWVPGIVSAAMVFPSDARADKLFADTRATQDNLGQLRGYVNIGRMRWVRPENIRVLGR